MKKFLKFGTVLSVIGLMLFSISCSDSSSPSKDESATHALNGTWDVEQSWVDSKGIKEPIIWQTVDVITIKNNKVTIESTTLDGKTTTSSNMKFTFSGNNYEIGGTSGHNGKMLSNDSFTMFMSYSILGYDTWKQVGTRKK